MFKHTTKEGILYGFFIGLPVFVVEYFVNGSSLGGLQMGLGLFVFFGFLRPHIVGEQRETREKEEREESQS